MINEILKQRSVKSGRMRTYVPLENEREEELDKQRSYWNLMEILGGKNFKKGVMSGAQCCREVVDEGDTEAPLVTFTSTIRQLQC